MNRKSVAKCAVAMLTLVGSSSFAATTADVVDGEYVVTVPLNETKVVDETMVAALGTMTLVKKGDGTLQGGMALKNFAGNIRVEEGVYELKDKSGVGTTAGSTAICSGATLLVSAAADFSGVAEQFSFAGTGYSEQGALKSTANTYLRNVTLTDDALMVGNGNNVIQLKENGVVDFGGHTLTIKMSAADDVFTIRNETVSNMGHIVVERGRLNFESANNVFAGYAQNTVTVKPGAAWVSSYLTKGAPWTLHAMAGARIAMLAGTFETNGLWDGPVVVDGVVTNETKGGASDETGKGPRINGPVSGVGGFEVVKGSKLYLNGTNTFTGPVSVLRRPWNTAKSSLVIGRPDALKTAECLSIKGGEVMLRADDVHGYALPKLISRGESSNSDGKTDEDSLSSVGIVARPGTGVAEEWTATSFEKKGSGRLDLFAPLHVKGETKLEKGTVRLSALPLHRPGLRYYMKNTGDHNDGPQSVWLTDIDQDETYFRYVDEVGPRRAYATWPTSETYANHVYTGYFFVTNVNGVIWNFATSIMRRAAVWVDDQQVIYTTKDPWTGADKTGRVVISEAIALTNGPHRIKISMNNYYDTYCGPQGCTSSKIPGVYWKENFGFAYNPTGSCSTNSADYLEFVDPGDGSFLTPDLNGWEQADPALYRASFDRLKCTAGSVLDVNDSQPYQPFAVTNISGVTTVKNGTLKIDGDWTVVGADVVDGGLVCEADASVVFGNDARLILADTTSLSRRKPGNRILTVNSGTITGMPQLVCETDGWALEKTADGKGLNIVSNRGIVLIVR